MNKGNLLPRLRYPIVVEGRYDKSAILGMFCATVIVTDGFGVFNSKEKQKFIRRIADGGIIILTDSDAGGKQIRSFLTGILPKEKIYQLYIPRIEGKERRKTHAGKEGVLGVEGVGGDVLRKLLMPFCEGEGRGAGQAITSADMYELGLLGGDNSAELRDKLSGALGLPTGMRAKTMLEALNILTDLDGVRGALSAIEE